MIILTKINDTEFALNFELIEIMQETPDTTITLTTGRKLIVKESIDEIMQKIKFYKNNFGKEL